MILSKPDDWLPAATDALVNMQHQFQQLPSLSLSELNPATSALILVDMIAGFAKAGALASPRVEALVAPAAELLRLCRDRGMACIAFADAHTTDSLELRSYPPHCLRGSGEEAICAELEAAGGFLRIDKDSTNGFVEPAFEQWRDAHPGIRQFVVAGDCTDICVAQFALTAKAYFNTRRLPSRVVVPLSLVDTFDSGTHPADLMNLVSLSMMQGNGVELVQSISA
ncbi:MAG: cysteine hydrolase [Clostridiales bacterium]|nr:cysteine hydrolase [Clostridiales bacterium]